MSVDPSVLPRRHLCCTAYHRAQPSRAINEEKKQFTLYTHNAGPNGWKVVFALEEFGLTGEQKSAEHLALNPNGRIPTLVDHHNGDFVVWESNAILLYLVNCYDPKHKISVVDEKDRYTLLQWLFFQASGQGCVCLHSCGNENRCVHCLDNAYFGQANWFPKYHSEKLPSAIERYQKEAQRVFAVLASVLSKQEWLVGGKPAIADLSFITWNRGAFHVILKEADVNPEKDFPAVWRWSKALEARPAVAKVLQIQASKPG
ncbi:glutathione S-transferase C-terminal-like protein [Trametes versicolor FP-101664 SS1]|uniref:glutathione S-transferase C-terminal-like protein n=1 Tax=Trametes versicolor (strain FP-101664) TaxID=717944 RepID=UPI00046220C1|nr:glutathione S-transferase C-terminal-like protein [Trametes versicolor FP-101664 SS1]EIW62683.1 glutathione S-transferase C-terminal-like protein [Trametes versicolor FP-101664 SS1]